MQDEALVRHSGVVRSLCMGIGKPSNILCVIFCRKCDVINRGFSGYNTRWNKFILPRLVTSDMAADIVAITIFLGANDSNNDSSKQAVPILEYKQNLIDMGTYLMVSV